MRIVGDNFGPRAGRGRAGNRSSLTGAAPAIGGVPKPTAIPSLPSGRRGASFPTVTIRSHRLAAHDPVDARGNSWIPESPSPDKQVQKAKPDSGNILTGQATQALPPLPEVEHPDLPIPASEWRLPPDMPHGRDKIILDDWGPVVPKGWVE